MIACSLINKGIARTSFEQVYDEITDIVIQSDGKILATGLVFYAVGGYGFAIARFKENGEIDESFGDSGKVITRFGDDISASLFAAAVQPDGKLLVGGYGDQAGGIWSTVMARYLLDIQAPGPGTTDSMRMIGNINLYPNPTSNTAFLEFTLAQESTLSLDVFEMSGRWLKTAIRDKVIPKGQHKEPLELDDAFASGMYVLRLTKGEERHYFILAKIQ